MHHAAICIDANTAKVLNKSGVWHTMTTETSSDPSCAAVATSPVSVLQANQGHARIYKCPAAEKACTNQKMPTRRRATGKGKGSDKPPKQFPDSVAAAVTAVAASVAGSEIKVFTVCAPGYHGV